MRLRPELAVVLIAAFAIQTLLGDRAGGAETPLARAPERLSQTGLYSDITVRRIAPANLHFEPQYPLWSDGAEKSRWIQLPAGSTIAARDSWSFPVGTRFWKEFAFGERKIETRLLWRASESQWIFATYVWNDEQTEAYLAPVVGVKNHFELAEGAKYSIPGVNDCLACHTGAVPVLGFNALQLSDDRDALAPHAQPLQGTSLTLRRLDELRLLQPRRRDLVDAPPRIQARSDRERAVLGYLSSNCGNCHNDRGDLAHLGLFLHAGLHSPEPGVVTTVDVKGEWALPGKDAESRRIATADPDSSTIIHRMSSRRPISQMPPLGTAVADREAIALIRAWIEHDLTRSEDQ